MLFHYSAGIGRSGGQSILFCPCTVLHVEKLSMHFSETMIKQYTMENKVLTLYMGKFIFNVSGSILCREVLSCVLYSD